MCLLLTKAHKRGGCGPRDEVRGTCAVEGVPGGSYALEIKVHEMRKGRISVLCELRRAVLELSHFGF